jgi:23S rRNA (cytosine1962-C5)-methyltransferase
MNFLRLNDYLLSVLFEDEDIIAIDKPYGFNAHTNDSKIEHSEFIQDGLIEIFEKQLKRKLHIVHRLDQTTTGVMIFGKSTEAAKKYADYFFNRQVKKTYLFITKSKSVKSYFLIDIPILHKAKELEAKTELSLIKNSKDFELWRAKPFTGRNHQIRIHAKIAEIPILGDSKYGGSKFPFLCLHNYQIEFPNGIVITSTPPPYFENLSLLESFVLTKALFERDRRLRLFSSAKEDQCFRLAHTINNNTDSGFIIDQLGKVLALSWYKEIWSDLDFKKFSFFSTLVNKPIFVRLMTNKKTFYIYPEGFTADPPPSSWVAHENLIRYEIRTDLGSSLGLFLNQRLQRHWVYNHSINKSVLNLFSHTGSYSLAAACGHALKVTSVESNKNFLNWSKKNFELNGIDSDKIICLYRDRLSFLVHCRSKTIRDDLIICDAPSFLRREKAIFKIETGITGLIQNCIECLNPKGELLFSSNCDSFYIDDIRKIILKVQSVLNLKNLEIHCILPSLDFELPDEKANLKSFILVVPDYN